MEFKIEKNIPKPPKGRESKYPLLKMEIGDCFFIPCKDVHAINSARSSVWGLAKAKGIKITGAKEKGGLRIWRIK